MDENTLFDFIKKLHMMQQARAEEARPAQASLGLQAGAVIRIRGPVWDPDRVTEAKVVRLQSAPRVNIWAEPQ